MCYNFNSKGVSLKKAMRDFDVETEDTTNMTLGQVNAFVKQTNPSIPAIVNRNGIVLLGTFWGTQKNPDSPTKGKNLKSENTYTFYRKIEQNRCLIPASSYYEHKTLAVEGKKTPLKLKHEMFWKGKEQFYIGAFYDIYEDGNIGFGLLTTLPNPVQAEIHNRMIMTFDAKKGREFLDQKPIEEFQYPNYSPQLEFVNLEPEKIPNTLF